MSCASEHRWIRNTEHILQSDTLPLGDPDLTSRCRNCGKPAAIHSEGRCLFDSTTYMYSRRYKEYPLREVRNGVTGELINKYIPFEWRSPVTKEVESLRLVMAGSYVETDFPLILVETLDGGVRCVLSANLPVPAAYASPLPSPAYPFFDDLTLFSAVVHLGIVRVLPGARSEIDNFTISYGTIHPNF